MVKSDFWNEERTERVVKLWMGGYSSGQIADLMETTRSAIIGKLSRMKIDNMSRGYSPYTAPSVAQKPSRKLKRRKPGEDIKRAVKMTYNSIKRNPSELTREQVTRHEAELRSQSERVVGKKDILEIETGECRYPGSSFEVDRLFCADPVAAPGAPYCKSCAKIAYAPLKVKPKKAVAEKKREHEVA